MKIAIFLRDLGLGGVERCAVLVGEGLALMGFEVTLVLLGGSRNLWQNSIHQLKVVDLSAAWHPLKPLTWLSGWRAARKVAQAHDVIIAGTFLLPLYMAFAATRGLNKRVIAWVHGPFAELDAFACMNPLHRRACQFVYRRLAELVFVSEHARDSLARWLGWPQAAADVQPRNRARWRVLPNFVVADGEPPLVHQGRSIPLRLLFVGRIAEEKQPAIWLDTLAALNARKLPAHLTIVGDGPMEAWLREEAAERGLEWQITLAGRQDDVAPWMAEADTLLLTSSFEGCPLVVLEAMPRGLIVASTNAGGVYELFGERRADFVTETASGTALAELIWQQQSRRAELASFMRQQAAHYSARAILDRWAAMLREKND